MTLPWLPTVGGDNNTWGTELNAGLTREHGGVYNVKQYPYLAAGDGSTDDTTAVQAAHDAAAAATPKGSVYWPPGTYQITKLMLDTGVNHYGHPMQSRIRRKTGSFETYLVGNRTAGTLITSVSISGLTIDGNYGMNGATAYNSGDFPATTGTGLFIYGDGINLTDVRVCNCKNYGVWLDGDGTPVHSPFSHRAHFVNGLTVGECYGAAQIHLLSFDSMIQQVWCFNSDYTNKSGGIGLNVPGSGNKLQNIHVWGEAFGYECRVDGDGNIANNCTFESPNTSGTCLLITGGSNSFRNIDLYDNSASHTTKTGLVLTGVGIVFQGTIRQCHAAGVTFFGESYAQVEAFIHNSGATGTPYTGTPNGLDTLNLRWFDTASTDGGMVQQPNSVNYTFGTGAGTKIGTNATFEKIGFWNATPIVRPARPTDAASIITTGTSLGIWA